MSSAWNSVRTNLVDRTNVRQLRNKIRRCRGQIPWTGHWRIIRHERNLQPTSRRVGMVVIHRLRERREDGHPLGRVTNQAADTEQMNVPLEPSAVAVASEVPAKKMCTLCRSRWSPSGRSQQRSPDSKTVAGASKEQSSRPWSSKKRARGALGRGNIAA